MMIIINRIIRKESIFKIEIKLLFIFFCRVKCAEPRDGECTEWIVNLVGRPAKKLQNNLKN